MDRLDLEAVVPAFHRRVVVAVALGAHARDRVAFVEQGSMLARTVLGGFNRSSQHLNRGGVSRREAAHKVCEQGYAMQASEGVTDLAAPIVQQGHATYTLTVAFIKRRPEQVGTDEALQAVRAAADEISDALMFDPPRGR